jgi:hypothetical protein
MNPDIVIIQGKFLPRKGRISKIETLVNDINQEYFEDKMVIDIEDFLFADSTGIMKMKKILKSILKDTEEVILITQKGNRFHEVTMKTVISSIGVQVNIC